MSLVNPIKKMLFLSASLLSALLIQLQNENRNIFAISNLLASSSFAQWIFQLLAEVQDPHGDRTMLSYDKHSIDMAFWLHQENRLSQVLIHLDVENSRHKSISDK